MNQQSNKPRLSQLADGSYYMEWDCSLCLDSGIAVDMYGPDQCKACNASRGAIAYRLFGAIADIKFKNGAFDKQLLTMAQLLVSFNAATPLPGKALASLLTLDPEAKTDQRMVKHLAKRLRDEWRLPVVGTREPPYGYFFAANPQEFLAWMRTTRSQAISELATAYHLFKANFPTLAGQQQLEFVNGVTEELQEAIR